MTDDTCLSRFTRQAEQRGAAPAVCEGERTVSFAELDERAARVAGTLIAGGVRPGELVGLLLPSSAGFLAGLLGTWRAGAAFVPLDPGQPDARLGRILADTGARVVVTDHELAAGRAELLAGRRTVDVAGTGEYREHRKPSPGDLAYVLCTSGSTGRPKGVMVPHAAVTRYVDWLRAVLPVAAPVSSLCHTSTGFDFTYSGLLLSLSTGGCVVVAPPRSRLEDLGELIATAGVDLVRLTPSHVDVLAAAPPGTPPRGPRVFLVGGEQLLARHVRTLRALFPGTVVNNHYGPTEAVIGRSTFPAREPDSPDEAPVPIGILPA
ncbi:AMP-binding protein [Amycolatopsis acidiphila]|uniref:Amino acid adenylation domain-containing protein n=1 Tax=Amycolatopsis acidiphila TaxID=715473 RepID=A0A557ZQP7_9PSEU|nr:AMP-binding protein [Amycolatopsis acidiphila]TVT14347.1 amino acid adenylation domain-containing protein [Amycolatopsis acidiphila]UIJ62055.1 AMP-binding protein [Amycolatopsis acidiphila]GHG99512.1 hypothetical protein GCM10017788_80110 [Amycolatopsis acidiphila]